MIRFQLLQNLRSSKVVRYVSEQGAFEFHYFFMRKFWMAYKCMGLVVMPGGAGERDWPSTFDWGVLDFCIYFLIDDCGTVDFFFLQ